MIEIAVPVFIACLIIAAISGAFLAMALLESDTE